ncbi:hypothetical protein [Stenotrophomonas maltophilia]|uniref:hypothetical protein n=1 Tax=Stenotrophomonas maltophilia TaxID=40324 RepID=UPI00123A97B8|nr:hypothetical protein [Stenotrophomonas maltophilia]MCU1025387.1 hypothetical protein [Stenotrophomonas maltophilia]QEU34464.1 hypothetical protein FOB57_15580 [Stenotrophomonas maltophilia]
MISQALINKLQKELPSTYRFAKDADHPLLMDGPDLMVGGEGRLTCIVTDKKNRSYERLLAQLSLLRLALPEAATIVLVTDNEDSRASLSREYDRLFNAQEIGQSLLGFIRSKNVPRTKKEDLQASKNRHHHIYSKLMMVGRSRAKSFKADGSAQRLSSRTLASDKISAYFSAAHLSKNNARRQIISTCYSSAANYIAMDNGTPYVSSDRYFRILLSDFLPHSRFDPEKPMRALAFSGNLIADVQDRDEAEQLIDRVMALLSKNISREIVR